MVRSMYSRLLGVVAGTLLVGLLGPGGVSGQAPAGPPPCSAEANREFDFWLGTWDVRGANAQPNQPASTNVITKIQGECVIKEEYVTPSGYTGESFNIFDASRGVWHQTWIDNQGGLLSLEGGFEDGKMILQGNTIDRQGQTVVNRVTWNQIDGNPDRVRQLWETSLDDGKTWSVAFDGTYTRRTGSTGS